MVRRFYKIASKIWDDHRFSALDLEGKLEALKSIMVDGPFSDFPHCAGPTFRPVGTASKKNRPDLYTSQWAATRKRVISEQGTVCAYCSVDCADDPTVDHIVPVSDGGDPKEQTALAVCCRSCNSRKGSMPLAHFLRRIGK